MYVWPTAVSGNAEREVQFSSELQFIPEMKMALCLIRDFESRNHPEIREILFFCFLFDLCEKNRGPSLHHLIYSAHR